MGKGEGEPFLGQRPPGHNTPKSDWEIASKNWKGGESEDDDDDSPYDSSDDESDD